MSLIKQHESEGKVCVVAVSDFDATEDLGTPFQVVLSNGVKQEMCDGNILTTTIENLTGLLKAVVQARVQHSRKLNGAELKFIRRAVGLHAKTVAQKIDISPEHLSRCEAGAKVLSGSSEKLFRALAYVSAFLPDPQLVITEGKKKDVAPETFEKTAKLLIHFLDMSIQNVFGADDPLVLRFCIDCEDDGGVGDDEGDDISWEACEAA